LELIVNRVAIQSAIISAAFATSSTVFILEKETLNELLAWSGVNPIEVST
jgi:hypothetical protein